MLWTAICSSTARARRRHVLSSAGYDTGRPTVVSGCATDGTQTHGRGPHHGPPSAPPVPTRTPSPACGEAPLATEPSPRSHLLVGAVTGRRRRCRFQGRHRHRHPQRAGSRRLACSATRGRRRGRSHRRSQRRSRCRPSACRCNLALRTHSSTWWWCSRTLGRRPGRCRRCTNSRRWRRTGCRCHRAGTGRRSACRRHCMRWGRSSAW